MLHISQCIMTRQRQWHTLLYWYSVKSYWQNCFHHWWCHISVILCRVEHSRTRPSPILIAWGRLIRGQPSPRMTAWWQPRPQFSCSIKPNQPCPLNGAKGKKQQSRYLGSNAPQLTLPINTQQNWKIVRWSVKWWKHQHNTKQIRKHRRCLQEWAHIAITSSYQTLLCTKNMC